ncbi:hypothetical protein [Nostoc sp. WHI]|uniref:hypothetical protein n=1 Tax=Nostoc sp. WHI TaxID=2650611 RepID=UPI0018C4D6D0|nr:hypothetical protein [Nostoc sp. WHI]MBG1267052.1 hypothetical protein [Nostoc sp. WHI]
MPAVTKVKDFVREFLIFGFFKAFFSSAALARSLSYLLNNQALLSNLCSFCSTKVRSLICLPQKS